MVESIRKKFFDMLLEAEKSWKGAEYLIHITYPIVRDSKLLLRALDSTYKCAVTTVSAILYFEFLYKRIELTKDPGRNMTVFFGSCVQKYGLNGLEQGQLRDLLDLGKKHKESGTEFSRLNKAVIMNDDLSTVEVSLSKVKEFLAVTRKLLENANSNFHKFS